MQSSTCTALPGASVRTFGRLFFVRVGASSVCQCSVCQCLLYVCFDDVLCVCVLWVCASMMFCVSVCCLFEMHRCNSATCSRCICASLSRCISHSLRAIRGASLLLASLSWCISSPCELSKVHLFTLRAFRGVSLRAAQGATLHL